MSTGVPDNYTKHDVINLAQWLIGEKTHYTNYIDSAMYQKHMELTAKLPWSARPHEHLATANGELQERLDRLTEAYATLIGDAMNLATVKEHMPAPFPNRGPEWCAQAASAMCRST